MSHAPKRRPIRWARLSTWIAPVVFLGIAFLLYANALSGAFVYDDQTFIISGAMRESAYLWNVWWEPSLKGMPFAPQYRPLTFFTFALNFLLTGESPVWFHAVSVVLHGLTSWLLFVLARRLFGNETVAWCTALLFVILPIHTEAVAYIKARDDLLVAFFGLLSWIAFLRATDFRKHRQIFFGVLSALCSLLAFCSKESALVIPFLLMGAFAFHHGIRSLSRTWIAVLFQALAIAVFLAMRYQAVGMVGAPQTEILYFGQNPLGHLGAAYVPWTAAVLLFVAVGKTFVPWNLSATYGYAHIPPMDGLLDSWMPLAGLLVLAALVLFMVVPRTRTMPLGIGALAFLVLYLPFSKLLLWMNIDMFGERWLYAPSIGLSMIGGYVASLLLLRPVIAGIGFAILAATYAAILVGRNPVWRDMNALAESMVRSAPDSVIAYDVLANERLQQGRTEEAYVLIQIGLRITRDHIPLHHTAAAVALDMGRTDLADQAVAEAERLRPQESHTVILRATVLAKQGRFQKSLDHLVACRTLNMNGHRVRFLYALNLWRLGRMEEASLYFDWDAGFQNRLTDEQKIWVIESF